MDQPIQAHNPQEIHFTYSNFLDEKEQNFLIQMPPNFQIVLLKKTLKTTFKLS